MGPLVQFAGTTTLICEPETTVKVAGRSFKYTLVVPVKFEPVTTTVEPTGPLAGLNPVTKVELATNERTLEPEPFAVVTVILPVAEPAGTVAVICVAEFTVKVALRRLNFTEVAPVNELPVIVTAVPATPELGEKPVRVGDTENVPRVTVPDAVVTVRGPFVAPKGTYAVIWLAEFATKLAEAPLKRTAVALPKSRP